MPNNREKMLKAAAENTRGESMEGQNRPNLPWTSADHARKHPKPAKSESAQD